MVLLEVAGQQPRQLARELFAEPLERVVARPLAQVVAQLDKEERDTLFAAGEIIRRLVRS